MNRTDTCISHQDRLNSFIGYLYNKSDASVPDSPDRVNYLTLKGEASIKACA